MSKSIDTSIDDADLLTEEGELVTISADYKSSIKRCPLHNSGFPFKKN